jgi:hypothetical protein
MHHAVNDVVCVSSKSSLVSLDELINKVVISLESKLSPSKQPILTCISSKSPRTNSRFSSLSSPLAGRPDPTRL